MTPLLSTNVKSSMLMNKCEDLVACYMYCRGKFRTWTVI